MGMMQGGRHQQEHVQQQLEQQFMQQFAPQPQPDAATQAALEFYSTFVAGEIHVTNSRTAETALELLQNRRALRVEYAIVGLIVFEIFLTLLQWGLSGRVG